MWGMCVQKGGRNRIQKGTRSGQLVIEGLPKVLRPTSSLLHPYLPIFLDFSSHLKRRWVGKTKKAWERLGRGRRDMGVPNGIPGKVPVVNTTFPLGSVVITKGIEAGVDLRKVLSMLRRHAARDWGVVSSEDAAQNEWALVGDERIMSAYPIRDNLPCKGHGSNCVWIITERDRSVTTILLPEEY
jgi:hypothetical protein